MKVRCLYEGQFKLAEGPVWCARSQSLWWVNMVDPAAVYRLPWGDAQPQVFPAPRPVTGIALTEDGFLLAGSLGGLLRLDPTTGSWALVLRIEGDRPGNRCNEIGVDPQGNLWVGTMSDNLSGAAVVPDAGAIFRITPDGAQQKVLGSIGIPNTLVWDARGQLLTADSLTGVVRRVRLNGSAMPTDIAILHGPIDLGVPDGSALAIDGTLWNARWSGGCLIGIAPDGTQVGRVDIPGGNITSACFAGPDLSDLVVTTSRWGFSAEDLSRIPKAGSVFAVQGVGRGTPQMRFAANVGQWAALGDL